MADVNTLPWVLRAAGHLAPGDAAEVCDLVREAEAGGPAIVMVGGGTQLHTGCPPPTDRSFVLCHTSAMNRLIDYQPDDLTVTCEPGMTLAALQQALAVYNQFLPLDVPEPGRATLGGIVSAGASGFLRPAFGSPRDLLIGLRAVIAGGVEVKGGGRVVKNVAGYDVCKLFCGAWGSLGALVELTFKVRPKPEAERTLTWRADTLAAAARAGFEMHRSPIAPAFALATNELDGHPCLVVGLLETAARVRWQAEQLRSIAAATPELSGGGEVSTEGLAALLDAQARLSAETPLACRISALPSQLPGLLSALPASLRITAHLATGVVCLAANEIAPETVTQIGAARPPDATLIWTRHTGTAAGGEPLDIWSVPPALRALHQRLKQTIDPANVFSPGRFIA